MIRLFLLFIFTLTQAFPAFSQPAVHRVDWDSNVYKKTVKEWVGSLHKISKIGSTTYIKKKSGGFDKLHRAGHRDVIVWIPDTTDLTKEFTAIIWFHGHYGFVPKRTFENRTLKQFAPLAESKNFVLVIPEMPWSVNTSTPSKRNSLLWQKPGDFLRFIESLSDILNTHAARGRKNDAATAPKIGKIDYRIVGHSAGGSTIKRLSITGDLCKISPSMVVWSDSSYGPWLKLSWDSCLKHHRDIVVKVFVVKGGTPWLRATQFMGQFQGPEKNLELYVMKRGRWSHKLIGDNIVSLSGILDYKTD